jgi:hypothetical protein
MHAISADLFALVCFLFPIGRLKKDGPRVGYTRESLLNTGRKKDVRSRKNRWQAVSRCR